ncbi:hypothetical protein [Planococcus sp. 4-30]|uniref:hypothetical protein n=1 Tax=Planococcus sp. 4-30 TaxID=2874583 RepID=UPI001CC00AE5|nr:hypothetical protein [Planococcus sp. 4-30]
MLKILFVGAPADAIPNHEKLDFGQAVALTHELELTYRNEQREAAAEFFVIGKDGLDLYKGAFNFGSYDYPNIYHQIKDKATKIRVDKEKQADKLFLLEQIEKLTPEEFKKEETIDRTLINVDKDRISRLKKWQRVTVYSLAVALGAGLLLLGVSHFLQKAQYEEALEEGRSIVSQQEETIETYEYGLLGEEAEFLKSLEAKDELTESQKRILASLYLEKDEFEKAVQIMKDTVYVETLLLKNPQLDKEEKIKKINAFNQLYPTNEARFDLAYYEADYELMMNIPSINMTVERSEMKTYGLLKLGKVEEAKVELNNNNSEELKQKVDLYEVLTAEIKTLETNLADAKKDAKKDDKAIKGLTTELKKKKDELAAL